jgi:hypothetical protein
MIIFLDKQKISHAVPRIIARRNSFNAQTLKLKIEIIVAKNNSSTGGEAKKKS